jgi:RNA polymerase primary sigma factor
MKALQETSSARRPRKPSFRQPASVTRSTASTIVPLVARELAPPPVPADRVHRNSLSLYLEEIGQVPLLTPAEEVVLARRIRQGDESAREHMIRANLRLVVKIARDYENLGLPLLDLINEGNIGLMKAVERFDPRKGGKFSTYGSYWIKQSIKRALANQSKVIRLPVHVQERIFKMRQTQHKWQELYGRNPDRQELSQELGLGDMIVRRMERACITMNSLDAPIGDDDSAKLGDIVMDERAPTAFEEMDEKMMHHLVIGMLDSLSERELTIIQERFGLDGGPGRTLEEIAARFGLTRERIRQLQNMALRKLRRQFDKLDAPREQTLAA